MIVDPVVDLPLMLENTPASKPDSATRVLSVGGPAISLDELGPIVINSNGTTSRIENWASLSADEQERSHRRISKRNAERIAVLRSKL